MSNLIRGPLARTFHRVFPGLAHRRQIRKVKNIEVEVDLLPAIVDPNRASIDVGANAGLYSVRLAALSKHVHVFEPHPRLARMLHAGLPSNTTVYNAAVSDVGGDFVTLNVPKSQGQEMEGIASLLESRDFNKFKRFRVRTFALDHFETEDVGFVKIDVEGLELKVLAGAHRLISAQHPTFLVEAEERHQPGAPALVFEFFAKRQYRGLFVYGERVLPIESFSLEMQDVNALRNDVPRKSFLYANNFLFIPRERWQEQLPAHLEATLKVNS